jgi:hypothetical protein
MSITLISFLQTKAVMISAKDRPLAISHWSRCARNASAAPDITDIEDWARLWRVWWTGMQPASRGGEKLLRVVDAAEEWVELRKGSINGFYNVVISLGWWIQAAATAPELAEATQMVDDAIWVMDQMLGGSRAGKRSHENDDAGPSNKR